MENYGQNNELPLPHLSPPQKSSKNKPLSQVIPYHLESMDFGTELGGDQDFFQMFWPTIISHKIGEICGGK